MTSESGGHSTFSHEEVNCFARAINKALIYENTLADRLPIKPEDFFDKMSDGMILTYVLRCIDSNLIDLTKVNHGANLNIYKVRENLDKAIQACIDHPKIKVVGIDA